MEKETIELVKKMIEDGNLSQEIAEKYCPELKESEDERIRKEILAFAQDRKAKYSNDPKYVNIDAWIDWLEKQNQNSEKLKLEKGKWYFCIEDYHPRADCTDFYQGEKYRCENDGVMGVWRIKNPEKYFRECETPTYAGSDAVRIQSIIQVLEYARSLSAYNQFGKDDITKDIAWLEKQDKQKEINLVEILKHYPRETELYSPLYGKLWLAEVDEKNEIITCYKHPLDEGCIRAILEQEDTASFYSNGTTGLPDFNVSKDCMLFLYDVKKQDEHKPTDKVIEEEKPLLEKFKQAVYDCAWGKVTCKKEGETKEEYANRWAEQLLSIVRDWADDYIESREDSIKRRAYDKGKKDTINEQKPADKVEPKFKVGDFVVNKNGYIRQIIDFKDSVYYCLRQETCDDVSDPFRGTMEYVDTQWHLWTIQDAKDGDVLTCYSDIKGQPIEQTGIIKQYVGRHGGCSNSFKAYFGVDWDNNVVIEGYMGSSNIYPSTKEQRDLLFQKMKEEGYEWDAEKKELKKVEEEVNGEDYGIDSLYHAQRILEKTLGKVDGYQSDDGMLEHKCAISAVKKLYEQKPTGWSEEDEKIYQSIMDDTVQENQLDDKQTDWLKSLKDRIQPKQKWSDKDYNEIETIACHLDNIDNEGMAEVLRNIRDKYYSKNTWKPSEEQMKAFDAVLVYNPPCSNECRNNLITLYNDLEKLREE